MVTPLCGVMGWGMTMSTVSWLHDCEQVRTSLKTGFVICKRDNISFIGGVWGIELALVCGSTW